MPVRLPFTPLARVTKIAASDSVALVVPPGHHVLMLGGICRLPPKGGTTSTAVFEIPARRHGDEA